MKARLRSALVCLALNAMALCAATNSNAAPALQGVNLAGPGFSPEVLPGVYGQNFIYPTDQEIRYFTASGMNIFRISVLWERLQPALYGPLDGAELARLTAFIAAAEAAHATVVIDVHNYGYYRGVLIGPGGVDSAAFADLWTRLAKRFGRDNDVAFGLMNEPKQPDADNWRAIVQRAVSAIRLTGAKNLILVSGTDWDGAQSFALVSGASLGMVKDPQNRLIFEVHQYFDRDSSGTSDRCVGPGQAVARLAPMTQWLRARHAQGFLGEFGVSRRPQCLVVLDSVLYYLRANADVWRGWTYWAAGPFWGDYMFSIEPANGADAPQMQVLKKYLPASSAGR